MSNDHSDAAYTFDYKCHKHRMKGYTYNLRQDLLHLASASHFDDKLIHLHYVSQMHNQSHTILVAVLQKLKIQQKHWDSPLQSGFIFQISQKVTNAFELLFCSQLLT